MQFVLLLLCLPFVAGVKAVKKDDVFEATRSHLTSEQQLQFDKNVKKLERIRLLQRKIFEKKQNNASSEIILKSPTVESEEITADPMLNPYMFQGDMFLTDNQMDTVINDIQNELDNNTEVGAISERTKRSIVNPMFYKWQFPIKYFLGPTLNPVDQKLIENALTEFKANTCIKFAKQTAPIQGGPGINVMKENGCWSYIGQIYSNRPQDLSIGEGCQHIGIVQHEFSHALGLQHEQSRPDRDDHVVLYPANMIPGAEDQFVKSSITNVNDYGIKFDMGSGMLYKSKAFSKNGQNTIAPKQTIYSEGMGQHSRLSFTDYKMINLHYCSHVCVTKIYCWNGGIQNPNNCNQCICPNGFGGTTCSEVKRTGANCGTVELKATTAVQTLTKTGALNCFFTIRTDANYKIRIIVMSVAVSNVAPCVVGRGLEVKFQNDMAYSGPVFCGTSTAVRTLTSFRNLAMVHFPGLAATHSFKLTYQRIV
uniref:Zinc metalloproteinase n=1 Tax=Rhabditophanes sp. KR3021 TaxID=114890 RepID=A0AC35U450_9BILA